MKRQPVAFAIENDGPKTMRSNLVLRLENLSAVRLDRGDGLVEAALRVQVHQHAPVARTVFSLCEQAPGDVAISARQEPDRHPRKFFLPDSITEDGRIKPNRSIEIHNRDINPHDLIGHCRAPV
jgi:hypothetical protein